MQSTIAKYSTSSLLSLVDTLSSQPLPTLLEELIHLCSTQISLCQTFISLIHSSNNNQLQKHLCLIVSKAILQSSWNQTQKLQYYLKLSTDFSISFQTKRVFERDLKQFINACDIQVSNYFQTVIQQLQNLIVQVAASGKPGQYQSSPLTHQQQIFPLSVQIPNQLDQMILTYIFLLRSMLLDIDSQSFIERIQNINCFYYLEMVHLMIFSTQTILQNPELFLSLFSFYHDFQEIAQLTSQNNSLASIMNEWLQLPYQIQIIYETACSLQPPIDYLNIKTPKYKDIILLKLQTSEFHNKLLLHKSKSKTILQLEKIIPSIIHTIEEFNNQIYFQHNNTQFVANLVYILSIYIQQAKQIDIIPIKLFKDIAIPLCECAVTMLSQNNCPGSQIYIQLEKSFQILQSQTILTNTVKLLETILQKYQQISTQFYQWVIDILRTQKHNPYHTKQIVQISPKIIFIILNIISWDNNQQFQYICSLLNSIIDLQFLENLTSDDIIYLYYFLKQNWKTVYQNPNQCQIVVSYVLANTYHQNESFLYFGLSFLQSVIKEHCREQWLLWIIASIPCIRISQCMELKWNIFNIALLQHFDQFNPETLSRVINYLKTQAQKEIRRMINQKKNGIVVNYGQASYYLGCFNFLLRRHTITEVHSPIIKQLLDFSQLLQLASQVDMQCHLIDLIKQLLKLYPKISEKLNLKTILLQIISIIQIRKFEGKLLFETVFICINVMSQQKDIRYISPILELINRAIQYLVEHLHSYRDFHTFNYYLVLLQKFIIFFGNNRQFYSWQHSYHKSLTILPKLPSEQNLNQNNKSLLNLQIQLTQSISKKSIPLKTASRIHILQFIQHISTQQPIQWQSLHKLAHQYTFIDYQAFLIIHLFSCIFSQQSQQQQTHIIDIAITILTCQQITQAQRYHLKAINTHTLYLTKKTPIDSLSLIHQTIQKQYYQPSIAQQTQRLFHLINYQNHRINQEYLSYLKFSLSLPLLFTQSQRKRYYQELIQRSEQLRDISYNRTVQSIQYLQSQRRYVKVIGDKQQSPLSLIDLFHKMNLKRESDYPANSQTHKKYHPELCNLTQLQSQVEVSYQQQQKYPIETKQSRTTSSHPSRTHKKYQNNPSQSQSD